MKDTATFRRTAVAASLVAAPVLAALSTALYPPFVENHVDRLVGIAEAGAMAWLSNVAFTVTQLPMLLALLGIAHLIRHRSPVLAIIGAGLGVLATFAEAVMGGVAMVWLTVAGDEVHRDIFANVWQQLERSPVMIFGLVGFLGTVSSIVVLSIGLFRSHVTPRWIPALLWAFLLLEFVGSNVSVFATYAGGLCLLAGFSALAVHVWRTPRTDWDTPADISSSRSSLRSA